MAYDMTPTRSAPAPASGVIIQLEERARDYDRMARALAWLADNWREHPSLDEAADAVGLSPFHFQRVFTRWAGVSPRAFVASIAHAEARTLLEDGASVLDAALDTGLSGPSRLHDLFIAQEAVTPGEARRRGEGLTLRWGSGPDAVRHGPVRGRPARPGRPGLRRRGRRGRGLRRHASPLSRRRLGA
jgi:AraC family transcriptional regulator of adaptative response/methylated-DNA-[protein]-cysteine methyltransferase